MSFLCVIAKSYVLENICWETCKLKKGKNCIIFKWKKSYFKEDSEK